MTLISASAKLTRPRVFLHQCNLGDEVAVVGQSDLVATVLAKSAGRVHVRVRKGKHRVELSGASFDAVKYEYGDWSRGTRVEVLNRHVSAPIKLWPLVKEKLDKDVFTVVKTKMRLWPLVKEVPMSLLSVSKQVKEAGQVGVPEGEEVPVQIARKTPPKGLSPALQRLRDAAAEKKAEGKPVGKRARVAAEKRETKKVAKQEKAKAKTAARVAAGGPKRPLCGCGCKEETLYRDAEYLRGHYARYIGMLKNVARGDNTWEDLPKQVQLKVKTMQNLGKIIKDHDERCAATTKSGGAFKTVWLKKQQAKAKREKAAKAAERAAAKGKK